MTLKISNVDKTVYIWFCMYVCIWFLFSVLHKLSGVISFVIQMSIFLQYFKTAPLDAHLYPCTYSTQNLFLATESKNPFVPNCIQQ